MKHTLIVSGLTATVLAALWWGNRAMSAYVDSNAKRALQQHILGGYASGPGQPTPMYLGRTSYEAAAAAEHIRPNSRGQSVPQVYQVRPVVNGYALLLADQYTAATFTLHAFDADGRLVADQLYTRPARWVH